MGSSKGGSQTIGFRYYMSIHMGISRGPLDEIVRINAGDLPAWPYPDGETDDTAPPEDLLDPDNPGASDGEPVTLLTTAQGPNGVGIQQFSNGAYRIVDAAEIATVSATGDYAINAPELFGGEKKEGGIAGSLRVMMGAASQTVPDWIKGLMGGRVPGFRGVVTLFFDGMLTALNPYPKKWTFRVRRTVSGWDGDVWQPSLATVWMRGGTIKAMNGAHIIYECLTNRDWGRGFPRDGLREDRWLASAQTLYNENFGLCLRYNRQSELSAFIAEVVDHIGGAIYPDPATGRLALDLLRGDYDMDAVPLFTYDSGLLSVEESDTASQDDLVNEVIVNWTDPISQEERSSRVQNIASQQTVGATNSNTISYAGVPTSDLSLRLAQRDVKANAMALKRYRVALDRRASKITPGSVFRINAPELNIYNAVLRAGTIRHAGAKDGRITVEATLDVYGLSASSFISPEGRNWTQTSRNAQVATKRLVREATYCELVRTMDPANLEILSIDAGAVATVAGKPTTLALAYDVMTMADGETEWTRGVGAFAPYVTAAADIPPAALSVIPFVGAVDVGLIKIGSAVQIGEEIGRLDDIVYDLESGISTVTIARGCVDTVPLAHPDGTPILIIEDAVGGDGREFASGDLVDVKLLTYTSSNKLSLSLAPTDQITIVGRQGLPYPPGQMMVNGIPYYETQVVETDITLSWVHRNRITQQDQLISQEADSIEAEAGTTYTVRVYNGESEAPVRTASGISGLSYVYTLAMAGSDGITDSVWFEVESVRSGYVSNTHYRFKVVREPLGYGASGYGDDYGN